MPKEIEKKFMVASYEVSLLSDIHLIPLHNQDRYIGYCSLIDGKILNSKDLYDQFGEYIICFKEVSIYEAIPELVPDGMKYNKELDELIPTAISFNEKTKTFEANFKYDSLSMANRCAMELDKSYLKKLNFKYSKLINKNHIDPDKEKIASFLNKKNGLISNAKYIEPINKNHRSYNIGSSNYASLKIQPWDIWKDWRLDPWDADIIKRISRTKEIPGKSFEEARIEDYEKIKHICDEKIYQLKEKLNAK